MTPPLPPDPEEPPPYHWLRRGLIAAACLLLALLALRLAAGWVADRRLTAHEAALRAAGHLATAEDLNDPPLPDGQNAAYFYRRAAAAIAYTAAQREVLPNYYAFVPTAANLPLRRAAVARNRQPLADLRTARTLGVDWGIAYHRPLLSLRFAYVNRQVDLGILLITAANVAAADGDSAEAVERVFDSLRLADAQWEPTFTGHQVGAQMLELTAGGVQSLLPFLTIGGADQSTPSPAGRAVDRGRLLELIRDLLDDGPQRRGAARAYQGDQVFFDSFMLDLADEGWLLRPAFHAAAAGALPWDPQLERALTQPTAATVGAFQAVDPPPAGPGDLQQLFAPPLTRDVIHDQRAAADRRLAAVALAVRLYQTDHAGRLPDALADLVPADLPAVPADPFRPDGGPLGYAPAFAVMPPALPNSPRFPPFPSPRLYSVGADGLDAGGAGDPTDRWDRTSPDAPFLLSPN